MSARHGLERLARRAIYRFLPRGTDLFLDIAHHLPALTVDVVFDVGANTGQSARAFLDWFPGSRVYCFEPVHDTFVRLSARYRHESRVRAFPLALGARPGQGTMVKAGTSELFRLAEAAGPAAHPGGVPYLGDGARPGGAGQPVRADLLESVPVATVDGFCREHGLDRISYLKIDTEGADLDVLRGAEEMLADQRVALVQVEAGMNRGNDTHVPFEELKEFLEARGYLLFGVYEQVPEWPTGRPHLRRCNAVFLAESSSPTRSSSI
ncbi:FkbM family methyltransferase [Micromonospora sp. NPDC049559]|uniref:FkbM family methyltransferase n=1 Tax=Micromonospora sp. NPDC049559 TaxID=3155923 RepID=UPI0034367B51